MHAQPVGLVARRVHEHVGRREHRGHVVAKSEEPDAAVEPGLRGQPAPPRQLAAVPRHREVGIPRACRGTTAATRRTDVEPLAPIAERADERDDGTILGPLQLAARRGALGWRHERKPLRIGAVVDDARALRRDADPLVHVAAPFARCCTARSWRAATPGARATGSTDARRVPAAGGGCRGTAACAPRAGSGPSRRRRRPRCRRWQPPIRRRTPSPAAPLRPPGAARPAMCDPNGRRTRCTCTPLVPTRSGHTRCATRCTSAPGAAARLEASAWFARSMPPSGVKSPAISSQRLMHPAAGSCRRRRAGRPRGTSTECRSASRTA